MMASTDRVSTAQRLQWTSQCLQRKVSTSEANTIARPLFFPLSFSLSGCQIRASESNANEVLYLAGCLCLPSARKSKQSRNRKIGNVRNRIFWTENSPAQLWNYSGQLTSYLPALMRFSGAPKQLRAALCLLPFLIMSF